MVKKSALKKSSNYKLLLPIGLLFIAFMGYKLSSSLKSPLTTPNVQDQVSPQLMPAPQRTIIVERKLGTVPSDWETTTTPFYSVSYPQNWKSYEYISKHSTGICPKTSCQDAPIWINEKMNTTLAAVVKDLKQDIDVRKASTKTQTFEVVENYVIGNLSGPALVTPRHALLYVEHNSKIWEIGFGTEDDVHQQIIESIEFF